MNQKKATIKLNDIGLISDVHICRKLLKMVNKRGV